MNVALRSISTTSLWLLLHMRRYLAAVAPPKPPPTMTTRCPCFATISLPVVAQPGNTPNTIPAAPSFKKSRRSNDMLCSLIILVVLDISLFLSFLRGKVLRQLLEFLVGITLGMVMHH